MARASALVLAAALLLPGCALGRNDSDAGLQDILVACRAFNDAVGRLAGGTITPEQAASGISIAQAAAQRAAAENGRWTQLAGNMRFAAEAVKGLDPRRVTDDPQYLANGPATHQIDAVRTDCEAVED